MGEILNRFIHVTDDLIDPKLRQAALPGVTASGSTITPLSEPNRLSVCPKEPMEGVTARLISPPSPPASTNHDEPVRAHDSSDLSYTIDCILERWGRDLFLLKWWDDGSCWWVPRENILDDKLLQRFEAAFVGFYLGVKVLRTRRRKGRIEYRIRWNGRPEGEDVWVPERQMSPDLVKQYKPRTKQARRRKARF